jgi:hypothetical protein
LRRTARTTPRVNVLLEGTSAHVDYGLASGGYGVQQSGRPTSVPHYSAPRMQTPSSNRNLQNDFNSPESISPWSYNNLMKNTAPEEILRPRRHVYKPAWDHMAGESMSSYTPSNQQFEIEPDTIIKQLRPETQQALKDRLVFM